MAVDNLPLVSNVEVELQRISRDFSKLPDFPLDFFTETPHPIAAVDSEI